MDPSPFRAPLEIAARSALQYLDDLQANPVSAKASMADLRNRLSKPLNAQPILPEQVIEELVRDTAGGLLGMAGGRFFAWAVGGSVPASLAADWLTSAWDQNAGIYAGGPAAAIVEEVAGAWLKDLLHLPSEASFAFVSGCQMAHATCLAAARHGVLAQQGWDVERDGLSGAPRIQIVASNRHGSIARAVKLLGLGESNVIDLPLDDTERVAPETLEAALAPLAGSPLIVILQAGDLNTGSFDRYRELIPIAKKHGAWVHIDGAFGLWAAASDRYRSLLDGAGLADSWATDGHKWLNVPYDCGYAFVAHPDAHRAAMAHQASYLVYDAQARDQLDWNPEWSRRARGFATYAAIRQLGRQGIADLVDRCCAHARALVEGIGGLPGVEVLWRPVIDQGLVAFHAPAPDTDTMIQRLLAHGGAFFMATTWRGRRAMRISVLNWQTNENDVARAIAAVQDCLESR